jgi:hypothetical protein
MSVVVRSDEGATLVEMAASAEFLIGFSNEPIVELEAPYLPYRQIVFNSVDFSVSTECI